MPLFFVVRRHFEKQLRQACDSAQQQSSRESGFLQEQLGAVIQIQLLHGERSQVQAFLERATARMKALNQRTLTEISFRTCYMAVIALGTIAILGYGGCGVFLGAFNVRGRVAFFRYLCPLFFPPKDSRDTHSPVYPLNPP